MTHRLLECFDAVDIVGVHELLERNRDDQRVIEESYDLLLPDAPLRKSIKEMKVDLDLINETLLHLEGYYAREVATEIQHLTQAFHGDALGQAILDTIVVPTAGHLNHRIPEDINWMDEMVYQIALAYQRQNGSELLASLRERKVSELLREEITSRVFGHEVCVSARDLFTILKLGMSFLPIAEIDNDIYSPWTSFGSCFAFASIVFGKAVFHVAAQADVDSIGVFLAGE